MGEISNPKDITMLSLGQIVDEYGERLNSYIEFNEDLTYENFNLKKSMNLEKRYYGGKNDKESHLFEDLDLKTDSHKKEDMDNSKFYFGLTNSIVVKENGKLKEHNNMLFETIDNLREKVNKMETELTSYKDHNDNLELKLSKLTDF